MKEILDPINFEILFIIGPSGSGKTYLSKWIYYNYPNHHLNMSTTTRKRRWDEEFVEFNFVNDQEFDELDFLFKTKNYNEKKYGCERNQFKKNKVNIFVCDIDTTLNSVKRIKTNKPINIIVLQPSYELLCYSLINDKRFERLKLIKKEIDKLENLQYLKNVNFIKIKFNNYDKMLDIFVLKYYQKTCIGYKLNYGWKNPSSKLWYNIVS